MANSKPPGNANLPIGVVSSAPRKKVAFPIGEVSIPPATSRRSKTADQEIGAPSQPTSPWHSRGYLPHFDPGNANLPIGACPVVQHVTFHLADSLPKSTLQRLESELKLLPESKRDSERRKRIDAWIDAGHGSCILQTPSVAAAAQAALLSFDAQRYRLLAWVVMPNHIHALFQPIPPWTVAKIVASWKKFTAKKICDTRRNNGQTPPGPVWHREYWDRYIRNQEHFSRVVDYIHMNPVNARLAAAPQLWPWSSASPGNANLPIGGVNKDSRNINLPTGGTSHRTP